MTILDFKVRRLLGGVGLLVSEHGQKLCDILRLSKFSIFHEK